MKRTSPLFDADTAQIDIAYQEEAVQVVPEASAINSFGPIQYAKIHLTYIVGRAIVLMLGLVVQRLTNIAMALESIDADNRRPAR